MYSGNVGFVGDSRRSSAIPANGSFLIVGTPNRSVR